MGVVLHTANGVDEHIVRRPRDDSCLCTSAVSVAVAFRGTTNDPRVTPTCGVPCGLGQLPRNVRALVSCTCLGIAWQSTNTIRILPLPKRLSISAWRTPLTSSLSRLNRLE